MRWALGIVVNGNLRIAAARNVADSDQFEIIFWDVIIRALNFDSDTFSGLEQDAVGSDFDIEFVDLIGFERLPLTVQVDGVPRLGCGRIKFSLRSAQPAARQESAAGIGIEMP